MKQGKSTGSDFLVVGGGVIGMMLAAELAREGASVRLFERGQCGQEASWAGGGIISPLYPWRYASAVTTLAQWSQGYYPNLIESIEADSGVDAELSSHGLLVLSVDDWQSAIDWGNSQRQLLQCVDRRFIEEREPGLVKAFDTGLFFPRVASLRNPRLGKGLRNLMLRHPGITLHESAAVNTLIRDHQGAVQGVQGSDGRFYAGHTVLTSGAWTGRLLAGLGITMPVTPVKGQMLVFRARKGLLRGIVLHQGRYLIPRRDGRVVVGSTLEHTGFDKSVTVEARESLTTFARNLCPALLACPVERQWAGLRPGSPDGVPFIGAVPGIPGLSVNAGHFRNGLVMAPAAARLQAACLLGLAPPFDPAPYQLDGRCNSLTGEHLTAEAMAT